MGEDVLDSAYAAGSVSTSQRLEEIRENSVTRSVSTATIGNTVASLAYKISWQLNERVRPSGYNMRQTRAYMQQVHADCICVIRPATTRYCVIRRACLRFSSCFSTFFCKVCTSSKLARVSCVRKSSVVSSVGLEARTLLLSVICINPSILSNLRTGCNKNSMR